LVWWYEVLFLFCWVGLWCVCVARRGVTRCLYGLGVFCVCCFLCVAFSMLFFVYAIFKWIRNGALSTVRALYAWRAIEKMTKPRHCQRWSKRHPSCMLKVIRLQASRRYSAGISTRRRLTSLHYQLYLYLYLYLFVTIYIYIFSCYVVFYFISWIVLVYFIIYHVLSCFVLFCYIQRFDLALLFVAPYQTWILK
jgi:hypothetical protein